MVNQARVLRNSINPEVKNLPDEILKGKSVSVFALIFQTQSTSPKLVLNLVTTTTKANYLT